MASKELLAEYAKLAAKLEHINETLTDMNAVEIAQLIDKIRMVERKMSLVYTLFKQSVYFVTMQDAQRQDRLSQQYEQEESVSLLPPTPPAQQQRQQSQELSQSQDRDQRRYSEDQPQQYQDPQDYESTTPPSSQPLSQQSQPQSSSSQTFRSSLRASNNDNQNSSSTLRSSQYRSTTSTGATANPPRTSNAREEYQAATGNKSILSLSRGHEGRSRWGNHYGYHSGTTLRSRVSSGGGGGFESENNYTNRPRYH
ncbi:hypothetical protein FBU30_009244 [Linnemannia zychae]|nr:hypothetical protein FBU30_009244 [Linnemannia zychae]